MRRDMNLIRKILLQVEQLPDTQSRIRGSEVEGVSAEIASYHIRLLLDFGLVKGQCDSPNCWASMLTWRGHDYLGEIRPLGKKPLEPLPPPKPVR